MDSREASRLSLLSIQENRLVGLNPVSLLMTWQLPKSCTACAWRKAGY